MEFIETGLKGAFKIRQKKIEDHRGYFARAWCREEFIQHGLNPNMLQLNTAFSFQRGTVRGMHYQEKPHEEAKLVRCTRGAIYDVIVDLRRDSPTRGRWAAAELTADNRRMVYAPAGFAHGFQTLTDNTEVFYQMGEPYNREAARGVRWDDPVLAIA